MLITMNKLLRLSSATALFVACLSLLAAMPVTAGQFPEQQSGGSIGLEGRITTTPPTRGATITTPGNGAVFNNIPITVNGVCPASTLVKIFDNNVFVGSAFCTNGSYSLQISLFSGQNQLVARVYDALDQAGPDSNTITVTFNDAQYLQFGTHVTLGSSFALRGAPPGQTIEWPIILSGGIGPYAVSVDWGDGTSTDLFTLESSGDFTIKHTYKSSGVYKVIVKATDKNGGTAYLQLTAQATGATQSSNKGGSGESYIKTTVLWWPVLLMIPLIFAAFWVGRRHELFTLRKQLEKNKKDAKQ